MRPRSEGRAADEAAAMRMLRACPLADAKAAGFVKCPGSGTFGCRTEKGRMTDFGPGSCPAESGTQVGALPPAGKGFGPEPSGRTGFRPGSCETGGPRAQVHGPPGRPEASAKGNPAESRNRCFGGGSVGQQDPEPRFRNCQAANRQGFGPDGEPAGKPKGAQASEGPRRNGTRAPGSGPDLETARRGLPRLPGLVSPA